MSGYVLDGIPTAMQVGTEHPWEDARCPCGAHWNVGVTVRSTGYAERAIDKDSLRFHYTHCPKARGAAPQTREERK